MIAAFVLLSVSAVLLLVGATLGFVISLLLSIAIAAVVGTLLQRVDPDLVWFSSPLMTAALMRGAAYVTGSGHGDPDSGIVIGLGASALVPFLVGWADRSDSDFHQFLRRLHPIVAGVLVLAVVGVGLVWLAFSTVLAICWGHPYC
jgi:hypothetical protein